MKHSISVRIKTRMNDYFVLYTSLLSGLIAVLYAWKGIREQFTAGTWIIIAANVLYIPAAAIFKRKCFSCFYLAYSIVLVFVLSVEKTLLFNNFSALFIICIVIMIHPKIERIALILYFCAVCISFALTDEQLYHFFIHIARSLWFLGIVTFVLDNKFERKKLILYEDEIKILEQLCGGIMYQKEVTGYSENTVYRKLKAARERNGNITREQLIELYRRQKEKS